MHVGGVSLTRIDAVVELRRAMVQFRTGGTPWGRVEISPDGKPTACQRVAPENYARRLLDVIDQLREQRSKQLASRITEAALGIGSEDRNKHWSINPKSGKKTLRPREPLYWIDENGKKHGDRRFKPCEGVIIERLDEYKPDQVRGRRENRMLGAWRKADFKKRLYEACQLHGLHLREVPANYTSRQCSRTGLPGLRCDDVPVVDFLDKPLWRKAVKRAKERKAHPTKDKPYDAEARLLVALDAKWPDRNAVPEAQLSEYAKKVKRAKPLRLITKGGDLFVAGPNNPAGLIQHAVQADLTAAANIGLRALIDPDFPGKWWYVPCIQDKAAGTAVPHGDKVKGSQCFQPDPAKPEQFGSLVKPPSDDSPPRKAKRKSNKKASAEAPDGKEFTNFWSDPSTQDLRNATKGGLWLPTPVYWRCVRKRVVATLWKHNGLEPARLDIDPDVE
jgi:hypothetical protein